MAWSIGMFPRARWTSAFAGFPGTVPTKHVLAFTTSSEKHDDRRFSLALKWALTGDLHALRDSFIEMQTTAGKWVNRYDLKPVDQFCSRHGATKKAVVKTWCHTTRNIIPLRLLLNI